jgi:putative SOS response-associated peptidase YedK
MDGFFEWRATPEAAGVKPVKSPFWIHRPDRRVFGVAGVWERWRNPADESDVRVTCTILTTVASGWMRPLHDRMPVVLGAESTEVWLDPSKDRAELEGLLRPAANDVLEAWEVSRAVNRPIHDGPELIERLPDGVAIPSG